MRHLLYTILYLTTLSGCVNLCLEKGLSQASDSIEKSMENGLFKFSYTNTHDSLIVEGVGLIQIQDVWVEQAWTKKCEGNEPVLVIKDYEQVVFSIDAPALLKDTSEYFLWLKNGPPFGRGLNSKKNAMFKYDDQDSLVLYMENGYGENLGEIIIRKKK